MCRCDLPRSRTLSKKNTTQTRKSCKLIVWRVSYCRGVGVIIPSDDVAELQGSSFFTGPKWITWCLGVSRGIHELSPSPHCPTFLLTFPFIPDLYLYVRWGACTPLLELCWRRLASGFPKGSLSVYCIMPKHNHAYHPKNKKKSVTTHGYSKAFPWARTAHTPEHTQKKKRSVTTQ